MASSRKAAAADLAADPVHAVAACLARHLPGGGRIAVGYSGGLDSTVLLHALTRVPGLERRMLAAVHVHHGLSPLADVWAAHCQDFCASLGVALSMARVQVRPAGKGLEAAARQARYEVFRVLRTDALLLAQHRDDQAETVLLQMLRGASVRGLAAMPEARLLRPGTWLLRPFLALARHGLEAYALRHGLVWVEDESNQDPTLARNHVRHALLPGLEAAMPGLPTALARSASHFAEWVGLLDDLAELDADNPPGQARLALSRVRALSEPRARNLLRSIVERAGGQVSRAGLLEAARQLRDATDTAGLRLDFGDRSVVCFRQQVLVVPRAVFAPVPPLDRVWRGEPRMDLGAAGTLEFTHGAGEVRLPSHARLRHRQPGDRMRRDARQARRSLKDLLREAGIPPWQRAWLPVLEINGQVAWVAGLGAAFEFRGEDGWAIAWSPAW